MRGASVAPTRDTLTSRVLTLGTFLAPMPLEGGVNGRLTLKNNQFWQQIDKNPEIVFVSQRKRVRSYLLAAEANAPGLHGL